MKKILILFFPALFAAFAVYSQAPTLINYQGVARNSVGNVLPNKNIGIRLSVHDGSSTGTIVYSETRNLSTNSFGMYTIAIGSSGAVNVNGSISGINWQSGAKFLQVEIDPAGGTHFVDLGSAQLLSVPYALYAGNGAPTGPAGGVLSGTFPNPGIANGVITQSMLAPGVVPTTLPPSGAAGGDLTGNYPDPIVTAGAITTTKIADNAITTGKVQDGSITLAKLGADVVFSGSPTGSAGGDLSGNYPNPNLATGSVTTAKISNSAVTTVKLADNSVSTAKLINGSVTSVKLAAGVIPTSLPPNGTAGGDLTGTYPNPTIGNGTVTSGKLATNSVTTIKLVDASVTSAKLAAGVIPTSLPPNGTAGGDLTGTYPNPSLGNGTVTSGKLATNSVTTVKLVDASVTSAKLAAGVIPTSLPPNGTAGGDLTGTYPNPAIGNGTVTSAKLANNSVTTIKLLDASVTSAKLAAGVIPAALPPNGSAGGDLTGTYPNPLVSKLQGVAVTNTVPTNGQVLKFNGTSWTPGADNAGGSLTLPYTATANNASNLFSLTNQGSGSALEGINTSVANNAFGVIGTISATAPGASAAGIRGINNGTGVEGMGIWGSHNGFGKGVYGTSASGNGVHGNSVDGTGVFGTSTNGPAGYFDISNTSSFSDAIVGYNIGSGSGMTGISENGNGVWGITNNPFAAGVLGTNAVGGEAIVGQNISNTAAAVVGRNYGTFAGVQGIAGADDGIGVHALANQGGLINGNALVAELEAGGNGNTAVFKVSGVNVARIDDTGKGFFNGGTQVGGADLAEYFDVEGNRNEYEAGDVLVISQRSDRKIEKSTTAYSTLAAGVFATHPGLLLTEKNAEQDQLGQMVPMGVIGVIPTKVCLEGGPIKRGDLIVTSSQPGVAMKADPDKLKPGQIIGKALQEYNNSGIGKINVLVSIK